MYMVTTMLLTLSQFGRKCELVLIENWGTTMGHFAIYDDEKLPGTYSGTQPKK